MREGIWQPVPEFLSGKRLRDGGRCEPAEWEAHQLESVELCALQDLRHRGPVSNYYLGATGGWGRAELRRDVSGQNHWPQIFADHADKPKPGIEIFGIV